MTDTIKAMKVVAKKLRIDISDLFQIEIDRSTNNILVHDGKFGFNITDTCCMEWEYLKILTEVTAKLAYIGICTPIHILRHPSAVGFDPKDEPNA